jgi:hypothetical protein
MSASYQKDRLRGAAAAAMLMNKLNDGGFICEYHPIKIKEEQKKQRDYQVKFSPEDSFKMIEVKCENYPAKNMVVELISKVEHGVLGAHVDFDNDGFFHAFLKSGICFYYCGKELKEKITDLWLEEGRQTRVIKSKNYQTKEEWTTFIALVPVEVILDTLSSIKTMTFDMGLD